VRLIGSWTTLTPVAIPLTMLLLHGDVLFRSSVVGLGIYAQLLVKKGQLLVELAPRLCELVEPHPPLGVSGAVTRSRLRFGAARCGGHTDVAFSHGVMLSCDPCPQSLRRPRGGIGRAKVVDVGHHRVVREAGLSTGVHRGVPLHELPPGQRLIPASLEGEVGEVVGGEPKTLLRWVGPQHADDVLIREASDESLASRSPR
jgi:ribosomal protein S27E